MAPADSKHQQIRDYLLARLREITTNNGYYYNLERVEPVDDPELDHFEEARERKYKTLALLFPGEDEPVHARSTESVTKDMLVGLVLARRSDIERNTDSPFADVNQPPGRNEPTAWTVKERLRKDANDKLSVDLTLGGLAIELLIPSHVDFHYYVDNWDALYMPLTVRYQHPRLAS